MLWLIIYVAVQIFKYAVGPLIVLIYINVFKRAWNFFITETIQEWIYIHHYSKGSPRFSSLYMRLTDKARHNRAILSKHKGRMDHGRVRRLGNWMMITSGIIATLWVAAFGLNQEYTAPAWVASGSPGENNSQENNYPESGDAEAGSGTENDDYPVNEEIYFPGLISPGRFPIGEQISLLLTEEAREGARLRSGPGTAGTTVIEMLWGDGLLTYLGHYVPDTDVETLYWMRVRSQSGTEGYIGSHLVEIVG